jgi:hypothetical protein
VTERAVGEVGALLVIVMDPVSVPEAVGVYITLNVVLPPAGTVTGAAVEGDGEKVNSALVPVARAMEVMLSAALPVLDMAVVSVAELPTLTVPKLSDAGFRLIVGCVGGGTLPVPDRERVVGEVAALLVSTMEPVSVPAPVGV